MGEIMVRAARLEDAPAILAIYSAYVLNSAISFEYAPPTAAEFAGRMAETMKKYPYLVAEEDSAVVGYAYAGPFRTRPAYGWACELSIYLAPGAQKRGIGRHLYGVLEEKLRTMGVLNCYACIAYPETEDRYLNRNSADFHAHLGFVPVGRFHKCGYKFGRWYDMVYMEKLIGSHGPGQPEVTACPK